MNTIKEEQFNRINSRLWMWFLPTIFLFTVLIAMGFREFGASVWGIDLDMNILFDSSLLLSLPIGGLFSTIVVRLYLGKERYQNYRLYLNNGFKSI